MLVVFGNPKKKKEIFMVIPKTPTNKTSSSSWKLIFFQNNFINGKNKTAAKENLIKANVKGGMLVSASLKIGEAAPQTRLAIIKASIGFIVKSKVLKVYKVFKVKPLYVFLYGLYRLSTLWTTFIRFMIEVNY